MNQHWIELQHTWSSLGSCVHSFESKCSKNAGGLNSKSEGNERSISYLRMVCAALLIRMSKRLQFERKCAMNCSTLFKSLKSTPYILSLSFQTWKSFSCVCVNPNATLVLNLLESQCSIVWKSCCDVNKCTKSQQLQCTLISGSLIRTSTNK